MDSAGIKRFSNRVSNYVKFRPGYPADVVSFVEDEMNLASDAVIADVACGTGLSSEIFLSAGYRVLGVEPNEQMRMAAAQYLSRFVNFELLEGTAEKTGLPSSAVDLVIAAQAYHWFEPAHVRQEFSRVLKPNGWVALIWNERQLDSTPFLLAYESLLLEFGTDYESIRHDRITRRLLEEQLGWEFYERTFANEQALDLDGLEGRLLSCSYVPERGDSRYGEMIATVRDLFTEHQKDGRIQILYDTKVYYAKPYGS